MVRHETGRVIIEIEGFQMPNWISVR